MRRRNKLQKFLGAYSGPFGKHPLEVVRTHVHPLGHLLQCRLCLVVLLDVANSIRYPVKIQCRLWHELPILL